MPKHSVLPLAGIEALASYRLFGVTSIWLLHLSPQGEAHTFLAQLYQGTTVSKLKAIAFAPSELLSV